MSNLLRLNEEEFLSIEDALASTAHGRAFLRMRDERARALGTGEIRRILQEEWQKEAVDPRGKAAIHVLREELRDMSACIVQTRHEIAALRPEGDGSSKMITATGELDAIVSATERATFDILNGIEHIQTLANKLPQEGELGNIAKDIVAQVTEVLTACSFQDITGQRTTKVVNTLRYIEQRVNSMMQIWKGEGAGGPPPEGHDDKRPDAHLLNGPSLEGGPTQADIDKIIADIDKDVAGATAKPAADAPAAAVATPAPAPAPAAAEAPAAPPKPAPAPAAAAPPAAGGGDKANSQADIDALFK
jgi:chemotaxis regulatin CheY-phosphate phosphatase CheZ